MELSTCSKNGEVNASEEAEVMVNGDCFGGGWWTGMIARAAIFFRSNFKNFRMDYLFSVDFPTTTDDGRPRCWSKLFFVIVGRRYDDA